MDTVNAIILGIIQGLTEFLPVSSSAHLTFAEHLFKVDPNVRVSLDVLLHLGTLLALVVFFFKRILKIIAGLFSPFTDTRKENWNIVLAIAVGTLPAVVFGYLLKDRIDAIFARPFYSAIFLLITGVVLFLTRRANGEKNRLSVVDGLVIGTAQAIAILPGISRSGSTIAAALFLGFARPEAFEFSFLLSIPAVLGAGLLKLKDSPLLQGGVADMRASALASGFLVAAIVGILALYLVKRILMQRRFWFFSFYCWAVGILALIFFGFR